VCAGGASNSEWANEFVNDAEGAAYADWEDLYAKNAAVSGLLLGALYMDLHLLHLMYGGAAVVSSVHQPARRPQHTSWLWCM
jgi:hypothetical protein